MNVICLLGLSDACCLVSHSGQLQVPVSHAAEHMQTVHGLRRGMLSSQHTPRAPLRMVDRHLQYVACKYRPARTLDRRGPTFSLAMAAGSGFTSSGSSGVSMMSFSPHTYAVPSGLQKISTSPDAPAQQDSMPWTRPKQCGASDIRGSKLQNS